jgi:nucleoside-diphosphate-sugar epimerase
MAQVCVTGATGFLGGALTRRLLSQDASVSALARPSQRADRLEQSGARVVRGDLQQPAAIAEAVAGAEVVYHAAAMVEAPGDLGDFLDSNRGGTERVFQAALQNGVRHIVYVSSIAVYGLVREGEVIDESTPFDPHPELRDSYAQSKIQADGFAVDFARENSAAARRLSVTIVRPGVIYGPGKPLPFGLLGFRAGKTSVIFGDRKNCVPLNYIENLVDAMQCAAKASNPVALRQYIVLDDEALTLEQYHQARKEVQGTSALFFSGAPVLATARFAEAVHIVSAESGFSVLQVERALQNRRYSTARIRQELGWSPRVPLREALRRSLP